MITLWGPMADASALWPTWGEWRRVMFLEDHNTRVVIFGVTLLGWASGMVGSFTLLRKRALMGDALSHATLPGIAAAFMFKAAAGGDGKSLPWLLAGATLSGIIGVGAILAIRNLTRLKEDAALGAVLSVFFGAGMALLGVIQQMKQGHAAGLEAFIYGKAASMQTRDALLIAAAAALCIAICLLFFKEWKLLCFDEVFAGSRGFPVLALDLALMTLVVIVTIVGLQAVGLVLMIALLVIPAAAARFWTENMRWMMGVAGLLGGASGMLGAAISALFADLPSGPTIVLACALFFLLSMAVGSQRGVLVRWFRRVRLNRSIDRQHLLRAMYEILESAAHAPAALATKGCPSQVVSLAELAPTRSWSDPTLRNALDRAERAGLVEVAPQGVRLTASGVNEAQRLTRQHRLWELYLIEHADIAPSRVDRDADAIEHVLAPETVAELEALLEKQSRDVPASPHQLGNVHVDQGGPSGRRGA